MFAKRRTFLVFGSPLFSPERHAFIAGVGSPQKASGLRSSRAAIQNKQKNSVGSSMPPSCRVMRQPSSPLPLP